MPKILLDNVDKLLYNQCKDNNVNTYIKLCDFDKIYGK